MDGFCLFTDYDKFAQLKLHFKTMCKRDGLSFDEDVFSQTVLNCYEKFLTSETRVLEDVKNYLWKAFKKNALREHHYHRKKMYSDTPIEDIDIIDEEYDDTVDEAHGKISCLIERRYGKEWLEIFKEHVEKGVKYKDLSGSYGIDAEKIHNKIRMIKNYVKRRHEKWN